MLAYSVSNGEFQWFSSATARTMYTTPSSPAMIAGLKAGGSGFEVMFEELGHSFEESRSKAGVLRTGTFMVDSR